MIEGRHYVFRQVQHLYHEHPIYRLTNLIPYASFAGNLEKLGFNLNDLGMDIELLGIRSRDIREFASMAEKELSDLKLKAYENIRQMVPDTSSIADLELLKQSDEYADWISQQRHHLGLILEDTGVDLESLAVTTEELETSLAALGVEEMARELTEFAEAAAKAQYEMSFRNRLSQAGWL